jgi:hypothetical protein
VEASPVLTPEGGPKADAVRGSHPKAATKTAATRCSHPKAAPRLLQPGAHTRRRPQGCEDPVLTPEGGPKIEEMGRRKCRGSGAPKRGTHSIYRQATELSLPTGNCAVLTLYHFGDSSLRPSWLVSLNISEPQTIVFAWFPRCS